MTRDTSVRHVATVGMMAAMTALVPMSIVPILTTAQAQGSAGLAMTDLSFARRDSILTATATIHNKTGQIYFIALGGPAPKATDTIGTSYSFRTASGVTRCPTWEVVHVCIGLPTLMQGTLPLQAYTRVDPGADVTLTLEFYGHGQQAQAAALATTFLFRTAPDDARNQAMTDDQKRRQLALLSLGSPQRPIADAPASPDRRRRP